MANATSTATLPRWDMTVVFPSLESSEFEEGFRSVCDNINSLAALFDEHKVGGAIPRQSRRRP